MDSITFENLERDAYRTVIDHGFFDLLLGAALLALTLAVAVSPWFMLALIFLVIAKRPLIRAFSRRVVDPRVGYVRLGAVRLDQISSARKTVALAFFGLGLIITRLDEMGVTLGAPAWLAWLGNHPQVQMAIVAGIATAVAGWLFRLPRFITYALVVLCVPVATTLAGLAAGTGWAIATLFVFIAAGNVLVRFVQRKPVAS